MPKMDTFIKIDVDGQPAVREFSKLEDAVQDVDKQVDKLDSSINDLSGVDVTTDTSKLEQAQVELRSVQSLAADGAEIDVRVNEKGLRSVKATGDGIENIRQKGEGLQSAIPAIRGFGDELGNTSYGAGIASQAIADLGDFALITGERFAASGSKVAGFATKLGTVLGAAGLAGAVAGIAVQLGQTLIPKIQEWIGKTESAIISQEDLAKAVEGAAKAIASGNIKSAISEYLAANQEIIDQGKEFGVTAEEIAGFAFGVETNLGNLRGRGVDPTSQAFIDFKTNLQNSKYALGEQAQVFYDTEKIAKSLTEGLDGQIISWGALSTQVGDTAGEVEDASDAVKNFGSDTQSAMQKAEGAVRKLKGILSIDAQISDMRQKLADSETDWNVWSEEGQGNIRDLTDTVLSLSEELGVATAERTAEINIAYAQGDVDKLNAIFADLTKQRDAYIKITAIGAAKSIPGLPFPINQSNTNVTINPSRTMGPRELALLGREWKNVNG